MFDNKNWPRVRNAALFVVFLIVLMMAGCPQYSLYSQRLAGEAALARAVSERQVQIETALSKSKAAEHLKAAEIIRAEGVRESIKIVNDSLKNNPDYIRYLWVTEVAPNETGKTVIYIPTESNMPILESTRLTTVPDVVPIESN